MRKQDFRIALHPLGDIAVGEKLDIGFALALLQGRNTIKGTRTDAQQIKDRVMVAQSPLYFSILDENNIILEIL